MIKHISPWPLSSRAPPPRSSSFWAAERVRSGTRRASRASARSPARSAKHPLGKLTLTLLLAGAVGNLIDRAFRGFVVDMFNVLFMNFAVFNVAAGA